MFDNLALLDELQENKWKCVLDVWENEPDINLALLQEVEIGSSHIAGYSYEGKENGTAMIYQAFTDFFGFDDAPSYPLDRQHTALTFRPASTELAQINQTILSAYPVAKDHMQLLSLIDKKSGAGFDDLRRNYRLRREFSHFTLDYSALEDSAEKVLRILGFN